MPILKKLSITNIRNIGYAELFLSPNFNFFAGPNGSGKSSILESIYLLSLGRSFRGRQKKPIIQLNQSSYTLFAELLNGGTVAISRPIRGAPQIKISGSKATNAAQLAEYLPVQLFNADTFQLLEGSPGVRRQYLDWGVFHVEQNFINVWKGLKRALINRNALLKSKGKVDEILPWTNEFINYAISVDDYRSAYLQKLLPVLDGVIKQVSPISDLSISYFRGWDSEAELSDLLQASLHKDLKYGFSSFGPHKADINIKVGEHFAVDILSRGQQKLLVCALKMAQGILLSQLTSKNCVYLLDDLASELDITNINIVCKYLSKLDSQIFITCTDDRIFTEFSSFITSNDMDMPVENKLFHVKHGKIIESSGQEYA